MIPLGIKRILTEQNNSCDNRIIQVEKDINRIILESDDDQVNQHMLLSKWEGLYNLAEEGLALPVARQVVEDAIG